ncbi:N-acetylmuramoyl-L-alanine amidase [Paenibacillus glycanilyticus]|uniref:N-acetylmuramoyl-L-alanine amidase n=1 Tax=Paenibacillus glycanilyticus TaxID=126569 RepID=UPI00204081C3|nr:N-acetylmuramoyl-L-alanine amidase [Paenibacillus glycanilyticus]MCM3628441.1 N-acetylmuramoyl-L-alanine amidase [Paenibacillus glycanilyticus]
MKKIVCLAILICGLISISGYLPNRVEASGSYTAKVYTDSLNVRSEPSRESLIVGGLKNGEMVTVSDEEYGWLRIKSDRVSGWAAGHYMKKVDGNVVTASAADQDDSVQKSSAAARATVLADRLRLRAGAGLNHEILGYLTKGEAVTIIDNREGWVRVQTPDKQLGWVSDRYIAKGETQTGAVASGKSKSLKGKVIVIDPGHGGDDPGMIGTTYETIEKELNLSTSFYLEDELRSRGARVLMTRTKNEEKPALTDRVKISESAGADAFFSIHYNSSEKNTSGILTFYYSNTKDRPLARAIENRLADGIGLKSNGISYGNLHVLRENDTVSALIELGFLSNAKDESIVRDSDYQKIAANAIANGLEDYFSR